MRVLTVAAHPDDETLGAGGTMAWHAARGDTVWACVLADGASSRHDHVEQQADCARQACEVLGVERLVMVGLPDQRLDTLGLLEVITPIERCIEVTWSRPRAHRTRWRHRPRRVDGDSAYTRASGANVTR